jgi:hypothetical protein
MTFIDMEKGGGPVVLVVTTVLKDCNTVLKKLLLYIPHFRYVAVVLKSDIHY